MEKKNLSDLEKINEERRKAEGEYIESRNKVLEVQRIMKEGITGFEELVLYLSVGIDDARMLEDAARKHNNSIVYSEAIAVHREFRKLLSLVLLSEIKEQSEAWEIGGTEENHRSNNEGMEGYE